MPRLPSPLLVAILLASALAPAAQASSAEVVGTMPLPATENGSPQGLVGAAAVYHDGKTYLLGGRYADGHYSDSVYEYDHATGAFKEVAKLPPHPGAEERGRQKGAAVYAAGKVYYFGGATIVKATIPNPNTGEPVETLVPKSLREILEFDPATKQVRKLGDQLPVSSWGHAAVTVRKAQGDSVYLSGGFSFDVTDPANIQRLDTVVRFDTYGTPTLGRLSTVARLPYGVQDHAVALMNGKVYHFGGLSQHENATNPCPQGPNGAQPTACNTDRILLFNPDTEANAVALQNARLPYRGQFLAAAVVDEKAYLPGALLQNGAASGAIVEFDPSRTSPVRVMTPTLPRALFAHALSTDGQTITMFGGEWTLVNLTSEITRIDPRVTPPWPPRSPAALAQQGAVELRWDAPAYDGDSAVTGYNVYRASAGGEETLVAGDVTTLSYRDATADPGTPYSYRITAVNVAGEGAGVRVSLTSDPVPPGVVSGFQAFPGNGQVVLRWGAPAFDGGSNLTGYRVYRGDDATPLFNLPPTQTEVVDTQVENGQAYDYHVRAVNAKGEGAATERVRVTPVEVPASPARVSATSEMDAVRVQWDISPTPITGYKLLRGATPTSLVEVATLGGADTTYLDADVERGRTYYYAVAAVNDVGQGPPSPPAKVSLVSKPGAPRSLFAAPLEGEVRLTWQPPEDTGEADPATLRYTVSRDGRILAADVTGTSYSDRAVLPGRTYAYTVSAFNGILSDPSAPVQAAAKAVENRLPRAVLAVLTSVVDPGAEVLVDASQSTDEDGVVASYVFDFGDGTPPVRQEAPTASHVYAANGTYAVSLHVVDNRNGQSEMATGSVVVGEPPASQGGNQDGTGVQTETGNRTDAPGTSTPKIPGPGVPLALGAVLLALLVRRGRRLS